MPRVSVILPNYNYARYLKERVRSILNQTMTDFELLYLDDASADNSNQVMQAFAADPRVQMHCYEQNSGKVYQRWNDGAKMATGDWLWFAGADDSAHPTFLERLLGLTTGRADVGIAHCLTVKIDAEGRCVEYGHAGWPGPDPSRINGAVSPGAAEYVGLSQWCYLFTASSLLIRRDLFEAAGGFDTRLWVAADWNLYLALLLRGDIAYTPEPLSYYRVHRGTVTNSLKATTRNMEDAYCRARAYQGMAGDARFSDADREATLHKLKMQIFDVFAVPGAVIPKQLRFAAETVYQVVPDKRLLARIEPD